jgi:Protein of unknown function (DUF3999)
MTRPYKFLLIFAMIASAAPLDLSAWKYRKRIPLTPGDGLAVVKLDREVYIGGSNGVSDLRVIHDGKEVPFVLDTSFDRPPSINTPLGESPRPRERLLNQSVVPGVGFLFTIHLKSPVEHHSIKLETEEKNFRQRVRIETSQDGVHWAVARNDGAIFNFSQDDKELSSTMVVYPTSTLPFLRVTIFGWNKTGLITAATVGWEQYPLPVLDVLSTLTPHVWEDPVNKSTVVSMDQGVSGLPVSRIRISTSSPQFQRAVTVDTSDDGKNWVDVQQGVIARLPGPAFTEESLLLPAWGARRYLRLHIYNRDDQPLQIGPVTLEGVLGGIKFLARERGEYWLYYGNSDEHALPQYDLSTVIAHKSFTEISWTLGPQETNPAYRPPLPPKKPWSEQHPAILYTVLGGAVLALGVATLRFASRLRT